ncbi:hypothetical protein [Lacticaseibacillus pantheris]|jgi:hypothetical protein|uniref:Uncharacterized protein n=1 Tax=Lacticaseibacillus pantheris DSM 15945 = JCM 12539 = NBRC 106106 TaxID=1423783 RepID=A0A0R1U092_9LACO|nr:hypothetical protein [Lacticaseibacillus pantheris]KRL86742.1 hypothetical protein FC50_GL000385 [Lacticaseibacillus pantheris DSM 15945 = JCM 12539 = NBRC 106106]WKF84440.1 hypothetical protein QY874_09115 [Lacticaseibacillus pantheris]
MTDKDHARDQPDPTPRAGNTHNHAPAFRAQDHLRHTEGKRKAKFDRHVPVGGNQERDRP